MSSALAAAGVVGCAHQGLSPAGSWLAGRLVRALSLDGGKAGLLGWVAEGCAVGGACVFGMVSFFGLCTLMRLPEAESAVASIRRKLGGGEGIATA